MLDLPYSDNDAKRPKRGEPSIFLQITKVVRGIMPRHRVNNSAVWKEKRMGEDTIVVAAVFPYIRDPRAIPAGFYNDLKKWAHDLDPNVNFEPPLQRDTGKNRKKGRGLSYIARHCSGVEMVYVAPMPKASSNLEL